MAAKRAGNPPKRQGARASRATWKKIDASPRFRSLGGERFENLLGALVMADALRVGVPIDAVHRYLAGNKGDGGVDVLVQGRPTHSDLRWVTGPAVFQAKLSSPTATTLKTELKKSRVREAMERGDDYVLVTAAPLPHDAAGVLSKLILAEYPDWKGTARALGEDKLVQWLNLFPSVWGLMPEGERWPCDVQGFETWKKKLESYEFVQSPERELVFGQAARLLDEGGVLHVEGAPGVGKTRCVLEALRPRGDLAGYLPRFLPEVLRLPIEAGASLYGCLVIDECSQEQRRQIEQRFSSSRSLRVITIGAELERADLAPGRNTVRLEVLEGDALDQLALDMRPHAPPEQRKRVGQLSGGYPKLMDVMFAAGERYPESGDVWDAVVSYLGGEKMNENAYIALSLPRYFRTADLDDLASAVSGKRDDLDKAQRHLRAKGLLGDVDEHRHYVTPLLLGEQLARRFWAEHDAFERLRKHVDANLLGACISRLAQFGPDGAHTLSAIGPDALLDALGLERTAELSVAIASSNPHQVLDAIRRLLPRLTDPDDRRRFLPALSIAAWFEDSFSSAVQLLAEVVGDTKQSADPLRGLFGTQLGLTKADGRSRLAAIETLMHSSVVRHRRLGIWCAASATEVEGGRFIPRLPEPVEKAWRPTSRALESEYRGAAAALLTLGLKDTDPENAKLARDEVTRAVRGLVRAGHAGASASLLRAWAATELPVAPLTSVLDIIALHDRRFLAAAGRVESEAFDRAAAAMAPRGITDRLSMAARPASWGEPNLAAIEEVAQAAMAENDLASVADWCFSDDAVVAVEIGAALGAHDPERRLLPLLLRRARERSLLRTAASYCCALPEVDELLSRWRTEKDLARFCFEIMWLLGPTRQRALWVGELLAELPPRSVEQLLLGGWLRRGPRDVAVEFIELVATREPVSAFRLAFQVFDKEESELLRRLWFALPIQEIKGTQLEWEWATTARRIARERAKEVGLRLMQALGSESLPYDFHHVLNEVLPVAGSDFLLGVLQSLESDPFQARRDVFQGIANFADHHVLEGWATTGERARVLVHLGLPLGPGTVLERLLERFDISRALEDRFFSGAWIGSESEWLEGKRNQLEPLLGPPARQSLRAWAKRVANQLDARITRSRNVERAYEQGVLRVPWVADGA